MASKEDKKRKRQADGSSKPSKRVAIENNKVTISHLEADKWAPIIASTPGVAILPSITLKPYLKVRRNVASNVGRTSIATEELHLHSSEHQKIDYTAREEEAGGKDTLLKHYVGVYDPETGKLEVMEARKMVVRGSVRAQQASVEDRVSKDMRALRNDLGQTFGTKKAKKAIASVADNAIAPDKSLRAQANSGKGVKLNTADVTILASIGEGANGVATRDELAKAADAGKPRPQANEEAKDIKDVYTIDNLIGKDILALVPAKPWMADIKAKKEIFVASLYVSSRILRSDINAERIRLLRYMNLLLAIHGASKARRAVMTLPRRDEALEILGDIPEAVFESIRRKFSNGTEMSKYQTDLLITHLCAMACIIDNYEVDTWLLMEDLKLDYKQIKQYFSEIGAKVVSLPIEEVRKQGLEKATAQQHSYAKLKLPLEFPKVSFGRKK